MRQTLYLRHWKLLFPLFLLFLIGGWNNAIQAQTPPSVIDLEILETNTCDILISYSIQVGNLLPNNGTQSFSRFFQISGNNFPFGNNGALVTKSLSGPTNGTIGPFTERLGIGPNRVGVGVLEVFLNQWDGTRTVTTSTTHIFSTPPLEAVDPNNIEAVITPNKQVLLKWMYDLKCLTPTEDPDVFSDPNFIRDYQLSSTIRIEGQPAPIGVSPARQIDNYYEYLDATPYNIGDKIKYSICVQVRMPYANYRTELVCTDHEVTITEPKYDGIISGTVSSRGGQPISNVTIQVYTQPPFELGFPAFYSAKTDVNGFYEIKNIYYNYANGQTEQKFTVQPSASGLAFSPNSRSVTLRKAEPIAKNVDFQDQQGFAIRGRVTQTADGSSICGVGGVEISIGGENQLVFTDSLGYYTIGVDNPGGYTIQPKLEGHEFSPATSFVSITSSGVNNINFQDVTERTVTGFLQAGCDKYIGQAEIRFYSLQDGGDCISKTVMTEAGTGQYTITLPARDYKVEILNVSPTSGSGLNGDEIAAFFETEDVDLNENNAILEFTYRQPPIVTVTGFPEPDCASDFSIMEQLKPYEIKIQVWEEVDVCAVDTGFILILDQISRDNPETITIPLSQGVATYTVTPGLPNLTGDFTKSINISAIVGSNKKDFDQKVIVTGSRPRASTFASTSPEVPFLILRDPPGDASYSYLSQGTTIENSFSLSTQLENDNRIWGKLDLGFDFLVGAFVLTEVNVTASLEAGFSAGFTESSTEEKTLSLTSTQRFVTNEGDDITGADGDVFVGAAINLVYAIADVLKVENCQLVQDKTLVVGDEGFDTKFIYTESHIRETLIEQLQELRDITQGVNDSLSAGYANQIKVWEQVLQHNERLKQEATFVENRSFSGGVEFESSTTSSSTESLTIEFAQNIGADVAAELGINVAGIGFSGGVQSNFRMEFGESETQSTTQETTVGYVLKDDDIGDFFSVDIKTDPVYSTPVFDLVSGRSSCPHEEGTQPRDDARISAGQLIRTGIAPDGTAIFNLELSNISQSEERRLYRLVFNQASNPDGAEIRVGGSEIQQDGSLFNIGAFQTVTTTVTVERGPLAYTYEGLEFELVAECDPNISKKIRLSVFFESPCSPITLLEPESGWLINKAKGDFLTVKFKDYVIADLDQVAIQYAPAGTSNWVTGLPIPKDDLSTSEFGTTVEWNVSRLQEGTYRLRLKVDCGQGVLYSNVTEGMIDRTSPKLFGEPEPIDDEYSTGDRIAVRFNEALNCLGVKAENVVMKRVSDDVTIEVQVGCSNSQLIILPPANILSEENEVFEVTVMGVADAQGNQITEAVVWQFSIGGDNDNMTNTDIDQDGVPDAEDNCSIAANKDQSDLDGDGKGDACDEDIDGDGVENDVDNAPYHPNPDQEDTDGNGVGDAAEPNGDGDKDNIVNSEDNCANVANTNQSDIDFDGIGDACDEDIDGDGILNINDNCPTIPNIRQEDNDGNGVGNECEGIVSTEEVVKETTFELYPNPTSANVIVAFDSSKNGSIQITVYDLAGQVVFQRNWTMTAALNKIELPLNLADGLYFVVLNDGERVQSQKLVVKGE